MLYEMASDIIKTLRKEKGMKQLALAMESGVNRATISAIERGKYHVSLYTLERILDALGYKLKVVKKSDDDRHDI